MQTKEALTYPEFLKEFNKIKYKHLGLFTMDGQPIVRYNSTKTPSKDKVNEIQLRLDSRSLSDGYYQVRCKNATSGAAPTADYIIVKGDASKLDPNNIVVKHPQAQPGMSDNYLTYDRAMNLELRIKELEYEVKSLTEKNEALEDQNEQLEKDNEEFEADNKLMSEEQAKPSSISQIKELADGFLPILEEHFELERDKVALESAKLITERQTRGLPASTNQPVQQQQQQQQQPKLPENENESQDNVQQMVKYEDLNEEQLVQYSDEQRAWLYNDYINRFRAADPQGFAEYQAQLKQQQQEGNG